MHIGLSVATCGRLVQESLRLLRTLVQEGTTIVGEAGREEGKEEEIEVAWFALSTVENCGPRSKRAPLIKAARFIRTVEYNLERGLPKTVLRCRWLHA